MKVCNKFVQSLFKNDDPLSCIAITEKSIKPLRNHNVTAEDEIIIKLLNEMNFILLTLLRVVYILKRWNEGKSKER